LSPRLRRLSRDVRGFASLGAPSGPRAQAAARVFPRSGRTGEIRRASIEPRAPRLLGQLARTSVVRSREQSVLEGTACRIRARRSAPRAPSPRARAPRHGHRGRAHQSQRTSRLGPNADFIFSTDSRVRPSRAVTAASSSAMSGSSGGGRAEPSGPTDRSRRCSRSASAFFELHDAALGDRPPPRSAASRRARHPPLESCSRSETRARICPIRRRVLPFCARRVRLGLGAPVRAAQEGRHDGVDRRTRMHLLISESAEGLRSSYWEEERVHQF